MIKASDLRIGNLVYAKIKVGLNPISIEEVEVVNIYKNEVVVICKNKFTVIDSDCALVHIAELENLSGIPITEEWFLKFGFDNKTNRESDFDLPPLKYWKEEQRFNGKKAHFFISDFGDDSNYDLPLPNIEYAHQLQNLYFALTGEELTIK